jgi:hypothetical protein
MLTIFIKPNAQIKKTKNNMFYLQMLTLQIGADFVQGILRAM